MDLLEKADPEQRRLMAEECILLDINDNPIGHASKKDCHLRTGTSADSSKIGRLHRAFSVFLFNTKGELLLQKRSKAKVTFPGLWTNTCCSHPLFAEDEMTVAEHEGVRRAAQRRMGYELGTKSEDLLTSDFTFLTRIYYQANSDENWAEHEIDYILFARKDVPINVNANEVEEIEFVTPEKLKQWMERDPAVFTPWFKLITSRFLYSWWDTMEKGGIGALQRDDLLHHMK